MKEIAQETRASASSLEKGVEHFEEVAPAVDEAPPSPELTLEQEKRLYRKIDIRLMPMLTAMYLVSFLDRGMSRSVTRCDVVLNCLQGISVRLPIPHFEAVFIGEALHRERQTSGNTPSAAYD